MHGVSRRESITLSSFGLKAARTQKGYELLFENLRKLRPIFTSSPMKIEHPAKRSGVKMIARENRFFIRA